MILCEVQTVRTQLRDKSDLKHRQKPNVSSYVNQSYLFHGYQKSTDKPIELWLP